MSQHRDDDLDLHLRGEDAPPQPRPTLGLELGDPDAPRDRPDPAPAAGAPDAATGTTTDPDTTVPEARRPRLVTVVFGLVLLVIAGLATVADSSGVDVDPWTALIALMIGVGVLLLAGSARRT